jgi:general stress protein YciG
MSGKTYKRGFAAMDSEKRRALASKGGKSAHEHGHAHEFTSEEARDAGAKGGRSVAQNREHMARIGRLGGLARRQKAPAAASGEPTSTDPA